MGVLEWGRLVDMEEILVVKKGVVETDKVYELRNFRLCRVWCHALGFVTMVSRTFEVRKCITNLTLSLGHMTLDVTISHHACDLTA